MADNASITILRNTQANINAEPIKDGNILFTTDQAENKIYADVGTTRIKIGGTVDVDATLSTTSTNPVQNKVITNNINDVRGKLQTEVDEINGVIAPVQLTLTASQPYAIGEQFIYDGKLYTAISAIAEDATVVIGTNASLSAEIVKQIKSAKDAIGNLQTQVSDSSDAYNPTKSYKIGDLCIYNNVLYRCITACSAGSWTTNQSCFTQDTLVNVVSKTHLEMYNLDEYSSCNISGSLIFIGKIGMLYILRPKNIMKYNVEYHFTLPCGDINMINTELVANDRTYKIAIDGTSGTLTCKTNNLPSSGMPSLLINIPITRN